MQLRPQYNTEEGSEHCMSCPDTAYTTSTGAGSLEECVGPVVEVCSEPGLNGSCYMFYTEQLKIQVTIKSLRVISGEFKMADSDGSVRVVSRSSGVVDIADLNIPFLRSLSPILSDVFCSLDGGAHFRGEITKSTGAPCINWADTPMAEHAAHNTDCQNPMGFFSRPYCYVSPTEMESCDSIPECVWDMECFTDSANYRGKVSQTEGGKNCQNWSSDFPHPHPFNEGHSREGKIK